MSVTKGRPGQQRLLYPTSIKYDTPIDVTCFRKYADLLMRTMLWQRECSARPSYQSNHPINPFHTIPDFDTLKICSYGKHCEKRNCM